MVFGIIFKKSVDNSECEFMTENNFKRKLTAILSADVVGYSRLMGEDEETTVRTLNKYKEIIFARIEAVVTI